MFKKFFLILTAILFFVSAQTEAAKVDIYRDAISKSSFTFKYKIVTFPTHRTRKDALLNRKSFQSVRIYDAAKNVKANLGGVVVFDGKDKYMETMTPDDKDKATGICKLIKDGEVFNYHWDIKKGEKRFYSDINFDMFGGAHHSEKVQSYSYSENTYQAMFEDYNFGSRVIQNALAPIIPLEKIIATADTPKYQFAGSGSLNDGTTHEDFTADDGDNFYATRFYFDGDKLIKIATMNYSESSGNFEKSLIEVTEFSTTPDQSYLKLPTTLKDTTKRK